MKLEEVVKEQHSYFRQGKLKSVAYRKQLLGQLESSIRQYEEELYEAFRIDLSKDKAESYMAEISIVLQEIKAIKRHVEKWAKPQVVRKTLGTWPAKSMICKEPYGVVLVLAPWNYPMLLSLSPVAGAVAAGNCVVLKCSKSSPHCAAVLQKIVNKAFDNREVYCVDADMSYDEVLEQNYNYIFFTGSPRVGRQIMERAAKDLIPVSLELGGKSPCIVTDSANLEVAAKRIVWGKLLNAGQTCITVDYILADEKIKDRLIEFIKEEIEQRYPEAQNNPYYPRIISQHHYERLLGLIEEERKQTPVWGGKTNPSERKIAPVILSDVTFSHKVMEEEIFGPIIPVIEYNNLNEVVKEVNDRPHPLACYIFTENRKLANKLLQRIPFGGGCINDTIMHIANHHMPFGGVGNSGMGGYHGFYSFETFSHKKSVVKNTTLFDVPIRYAPFDNKKWSFLKRVL